MDDFGAMLRRYLCTWSALALSAVLCATAYNARAEHTELQAVGNCINQAEIAASIQVGRVIEGDSLEAFLGRMDLWATDAEVQANDGNGQPPPQGMIDYIEMIGVFVWNTFSPEATEREVMMGTYENCRVAWLAHFRDGAPAPVFYDFPIGYSEPVYSYTGGG